MTLLVFGEFLCADNKVLNFTVTVSDCQAEQPCAVPVGTTLYIKTFFVPQETLRDVKSRVSAKMGVLVVPRGPSRFVCPSAISEEADRCDSTEGLVRGRHYAYVEEFPIRPHYREISVKIRVEFFTGRRPHSNTTLLCFEIPLRIMSDSEMS
ncbi:uncharacterized protein CDAR_285631 [Caerostris darwini]|uniref:MD-2-related lipid-recognition domain-containing protein n=1 Tax=Caerostris darwini TaxID=1538125 RepID=A0AAV4NNU5_9ARAC|nr:uncharacterized protein CDAR_285631 [Caerostris darwini]